MASEALADRLRARAVVLRDWLDRVEARAGGGRITGERRADAELHEDAATEIARLTRELEEARERERRNLLLQEDVWPDPDPSGVEEMCDADGCNGVALHEIRFDDHAVAMLCSACYEGESRRTEGGSDEC